MGNDDNPTIIIMMMMEIILTSMPKTFKASFWGGGDGYCPEDDDLVKKCASKETTILYGYQPPRLADLIVGCTCISLVTAALLIVGQDDDDDDGGVAIYNNWRQNNATKRFMQQTTKAVAHFQLQNLCQSNCSIDCLPCPSVVQHLLCSFFCCLFFLLYRHFPFPLFSQLLSQYSTCFPHFHVRHT